MHKLIVYDRCRTAKTVKPFLLLLAIILAIATPLTWAAETAPATKLDYGVIAGDWQRTDGNYSIHVTEVSNSGHAKVEYFNPGPIHVEDASIATQKGLIRLTFRLEDKNYQGSSYKIYYYKEKDALVGFYHHGAMNKTFEVIFLRKKT